MKLFNIFFIFASIISLVYCSGSTNYELTYYGQKGEEHTKQDPSCPQYDDDNLPYYYAALGQKLSHYKDYCDNYAVFMSSDGTNPKTIAKAMIVDSCHDCGAYHLDVSLNIFTKITKKSDGEARIIWGVYSKSGNKVGGPWYDSVSGTAKKLGLSSSDFVNAFNANAKKLAASSHYYADFSTSGISYHEDERENRTTRRTTRSSTTTTRRTTTRRTTTTTTTTSTTTRRRIPSSVNLPSKGLPPKNPYPVASNAVTTTQVIPFGNSPKTIPLNNVSAVNTITTTSFLAFNPYATTTTSMAQPTQPTQNPVQSVESITKDKDNKGDKKENGGGLGPLGIVAIGGGCLGAAGIGLLLMKKKSPSTYEGMKQKFPDAFSNLKRGLSRRATSLKRKVSKKDSTQYNNIGRV